MAFDHRDGASGANPYAPLMGRTYVTTEEVGTLRVLDTQRIDVLDAWVRRLIPGTDIWPSAGETDAVAYIDAILVKAPTLRPVVLAGIDAAERAARSLHGKGFSVCSPAEQTEILKTMEQTGAPEAFGVVFELTYEAYYRTPAVQDIVRERTGFDVTNTVVGKAMKPFPSDRLITIGERADRYRSVSA